MTAADDFAAVDDLGRCSKYAMMTGRRRPKSRVTSSRPPFQQQCVANSVRRAPRPPSIRFESGSPMLTQFLTDPRDARLLRVTALAGVCVFLPLTPFYLVTPSCLSVVLYPLLYSSIAVSSVFTSLTLFNSNWWQIKKRSNNSVVDDAI